MACLYIERLKSNFQQADHLLPRARSRKNWSPRFSTKYLPNQECDECCSCGKPRIKSVVVNLHTPTAPKICAIGLRRVNKDSKKSNPPFWNIVEVTKFLQRYLNVARRYRSYLYVSWKPVPNKHGKWSAFSFTSVASMFSRCSKKLTKNEWFARDQHPSVEMLHDFQASLKNSSNSNSPRKRNTDSNQSTQNKKKEAYFSPGSVSVSQNRDKSTSRPSSAAESPTNCIFLSNESKESKHTVFKSDDSFICRSKKSVCIQTSRGSKSRRKKSKKNKENSDKENLIFIPTRSSYSKDVKTIFKANNANFDGEKSKTNLEAFNSQHKRKETSQNPKSKRTVKKSKEYNLKNSSKYKFNNCLLVSSSDEENSPCFEANSRIRKTKNSQRSDLQTFPKVRHLENIRNYRVTTSCKKCKSRLNNESQVILCDRKCNDAKHLQSVPWKNTPYIFNENSSVCSLPSPEITDVLCTPKNCFVEDKTSDIIILGNVKKRLEEDYDDYFSINEFDLETDLPIDSETPRNILQSTLSSSGTRMNHSLSLESLRRSRSMRSAVAMHQESKSRTLNSMLKSIETSLTHFSNPELSQSQCSYYTSLREQECTPTSSIEYCTASNISLSKFHSSQENSISAVLQAYSVDASVTYDSNLKSPAMEKFSSNDDLFEDNKIYRNRKFLDETLVNSFTVCCYQRNSTPNLSNCSRRITESLDSGILTDFSRDQPRASEEYFKGGNVKSSEEKCRVGEIDQLPTYDFNTDSSYSDESLNRRVDVAVKKFTENLILTERRANIKLRRLQNPARYRREGKRRRRGRHMCKIRDLQRNYVEQEARGNIATAIGGTFLLKEIRCSRNVLFQSFHGYYPTDVCRLRDIEAILCYSATPGYTRDCLPNANDSSKIRFACNSNDCLHYPPKVVRILPKSVTCKLNERTPVRTVGKPYYNYKRTGEFVIGRDRSLYSAGTMAPRRLQSQQSLLYGFYEALWEHATK